MTVEGASSSEKALEILSSRAFDAILCDFNLPGLKGEELFERLRKEKGGSPARFVFMTGELVDPATVNSFQQRGARVLQKPFQLSGLAAVLTEILEPQLAAKG